MTNKGEWEFKDDSVHERMIVRIGAMIDDAERQMNEHISET